MSVSELATGDADGVHDTLLIRGHAVPVVIRSIEQARLKFFVENPRIYSIVHGEGRAPSQDEIQQKLLTLEHVKELIQDIKRNGGLMDPVIVRTGTLEVIEGNSRLAAYRALAKIDPIKWGLIKATFLPLDIDDSLIFALLGQYHIKGKKDWQPFEQAAFCTVVSRTIISTWGPFIRHWLDTAAGKTSHRHLPVYAGPQGR